MKVLDFLDKMNKKQSIKTQRLIDLKGYYTSMYRVYMVKMYDACYISDPTKFNESEIRSNIVDMNIKGMFDTTGSVVLSSSQIQYAIYKNKNDENVLKFLELLQKVMKYKEYCADINHLYDSYNFCESNKCSISLGLRNKGALIESKTDFGISRAVVACLIDMDETAVQLSFNNKLWDIAMSVLEIPEGEWHEDGIFDKDLTHEEELDCIELLLNGSVLTKGTYSDTLQNWLYDHKWKTKGMTTTCKGLYEFLFSSCSSEVFQIESEVLNNCHDSGVEVYAIEKGSYYTKKKIENYNIPFGVFVVEGGVDEPLFDGVSLCGYTGEVYSIGYLETEGISYVGCPIELNISSKEKDLFYDIEQTEIQSDTWFKSEKVDIYFNEDEDEVSFKRNTYEKDSLEYKLYEMYKKSYFGELIGKTDSIDGLEKAKKYVMKLIS